MQTKPKVEYLKKELVDIERMICLFKARKRFDLVAELEVEKSHTEHLITEYEGML